MDKRMDATNGGRITDELREEVHNTNGYTYIRSEYFDMLCERIEAAHEEAIQREHETAYDKGYDAGFASADDWCAQHEDAMAEHGWVRLPKDADGEYIHVGDVMGHRDFPNAKYTVVGIGEDAFFTRDGAGEIHKHIASLYPHYKPTVEDTLHELIGKALMLSEVNGENELVAEYAKRLRLAGSDAE